MCKENDGVLHFHLRKLTRLSVILKGNCYVLIKIISIFIFIIIVIVIILVVIQFDTYLFPFVPFINHPTVEH
jgi:hypothetical protein